MTIATMTSKGQVTLPKSIRETLHLHAGDKVDFHIRPDGGVELVPLTGSVKDLYGLLKSTVRGVTVEDMNETIREMGGRL
jgi:AbrB family looped-hinge helix DNA binding protein